MNMGERNCQETANLLNRPWRLFATLQGCRNGRGWGGVDCGRSVNPISIKESILYPAHYSSFPNPTPHPDFQTFLRPWPWCSFLVPSQKRRLTSPSEAKNQKIEEESAQWSKSGKTKETIIEETWGSPSSSNYPDPPALIAIFWPFLVNFCQLCFHLSQNWGSDGHFEDVLTGS